MRDTFGEALIAVTALVGFIIFSVKNVLTLEGVWAYAIALGITAAFYTLLILIRAVFSFVAGDERKKHTRWGKK